MSQKHQPDDSGKDKQNLREENEFLKLKLNAEHGAQFYEDQPDIPAEVENEFLKNVEAFEKAHANAAQTTVFKKVGEPDFPKAEDLTDAEVSEMLDKINDHLAQYDIGLDVQGEYDDHTIYKFITEELFEHEVDDVHIPGMGCYFIYEEFHPNPLLDGRKALEEFLDGLARESEIDPELNVDFGLDISVSSFHEEGITSHAGEGLSSQEVKERYALLRDSVAAISIEHIAQGSATQPSKEEAIYTTQVKYRYQLKGDPAWNSVDGTVKIHLKPSEDYPSWNVTRMEGAGLLL